jgi:hypothetical protein
LTLDLTAASLGAYLWNTGAITKDLKVFTRGKYWLQITNQFNCIKSDTIQISFDALCVGIDPSLIAQSGISYFPNPNSGRFILKFNAEFEGKVELVIRNMQGQIVSTKSWEKVENEMIQELDLSNESPGVYFLDLNTPDGRATHRITLSR